MVIGISLGTPRSRMWDLMSSSTINTKMKSTMDDGTSPNNHEASLASEMTWVTSSRMYFDRPVYSLGLLGLSTKSRSDPTLGSTKTSSRPPTNSTRTHEQLKTGHHKWRKEMTFLNSKISRRTISPLFVCTTLQLFQSSSTCFLSFETRSC